MSYIFGKLWHLAIWAIRKAFQCILQGVRFCWQTILYFLEHLRMSHVLNEVEIWTGVTDALRTDWLTDWQSLKDSATQLLINYKSGALVAQLGNVASESLSISSFSFHFLSISPFSLHFLFIFLFSPHFLTARPSALVTGRLYIDLKNRQKSPIGSKNGENG